jgi:ribosomal protein L11 methyltransferase
VPYRIDVVRPQRGAVDRVIDLGALDVETTGDGKLVALMPDRVASEDVAVALGIGVHEVQVTAAAGRDADSVWVLRPRPFGVGRLRVVPAGSETGQLVLQLSDSAAFGTGLHPTTVLCLEALQDAVERGPETLLDVGTGSGILALAGLLLGVRRAVGVDIDEEALHAAARNAALNGVRRRIRLVHGGPEAVSGTWPLVLANVLAAPLIEMAPTVAKRLGHRGQLVLSGIPSGLGAEVIRAYERQGLHLLRVTSREGWVAVVMLASW